MSLPAHLPWPNGVAEPWLAIPMAAGDFNVLFVDQVGGLIFETITSATPRVGDHVDLPLQRVAGEVDLVTWQVTDADRTSRVIVRIKPHS
jgi:hypothetical protein